MGSVENSARIKVSLCSDMELGTSQAPCDFTRTEDAGSLVDGNAVDCAVSRGDCDIPSVGCAGCVNACEDTDSFRALGESCLGEERNNECDDEMMGIFSEIAPGNLSDGDGMSLKGVSENGFLVVSAKDRECLPAELVKTEQVSDSSGDKEATYPAKPSVGLPELAEDGMLADNVHEIKQNKSRYHLVEAHNALSRVDMATCVWESVSLSKALLDPITMMDALNSDFCGELDSNRIVGLKDGIVLHAAEAKVSPDARPVEVISPNSQKPPANKFLCIDVQGIKQASGACVKVPSVQKELHFVEEKVDGHARNLGDGCNHMLGSAVGNVMSEENLSEEQWNGSLKMLKGAMSEEVYNSPQRVDLYDRVLSSDSAGVPLENGVNISCSSDNSKDLCVDASITNTSLLLSSKDHDGTLGHSCPVDADIESAKNNKETSMECVEMRVNSDGNGIDEAAPVKRPACEISALEVGGQIPSDDLSSFVLFSNVQNGLENNGLICNVVMQKCMKASHVEGNVVKLNAGATAPGCSAEALDIMQACQPSLTFENCCSNMQDLSSLESTIETGFISTVESEERNDEEKCTAAPNSFSEAKVPVIVFSSSRRSSQVNKSGRKTQAKRAARNSRNASKVSSSSENKELILKAAKRKRSSCFKKAKSFEWGRLQNISKLFVQMNELDLEHISGRGSQKARSGRRGQNQKRKQATGSRQVSKGKQHVSAGCVRLKVKLGKSELNIVGPQVASTTPSPNAIASETSLQERNCSEVPICAADSEHNLKEDGVRKAAESIDNNPEKKFDQNNAQETTTFLKKNCGDAEKGYLDVASFAEMGGVTDSRYLGPETSPDSEVINTTPDAQAVETHGDGIHCAVLHSTEDLNSCKNNTSTRREKKTNRVSNGSNQSNGSSNSSVPKSKQVKKNGCRMKSSRRVHLGESLILSNTCNSSSNNKELAPLSTEMEVGFSNVSLTDAGNEAPSCQDKSPCLSELENTKSVLSSAKRSGQKLPKGSKSSRSGAKSKASNSTKGKGGNARRPKEKQRRSANKRKVKDNGISHQFPCKAECQAEADGGQVDDGCKKIDTSADPAVVDNLKSELMPGKPVEQQRNAWVRCDDCHKWRRIPVALADSIEDTNSNWTCNDNMDKNFANCSIPQEKSNAEINAELEISDASGEDDDYSGRRNYKELEFRRPPVFQQSSFIQIDSNKFLHRSRRTQTIDEVMVCHCMPRSDGRLGCGDECLNRMLNIECVQGTCPCGDLCSNQQFQKRNYAQMQWFRCGKKGYGLQLLQDVRKGGFIIEYVGEVLDMPTYEERQREYASKGHKHFYFMTLNGSEVIDASAKGNLGRFINHSCEPNCRTEKWMVNGEICIGLFALRDLKKGEEVTFDYNYVRVFGAAVKKCVCGSPLCRGYIGGDPLNTEVIVQVDSDDEYPEPVMLLEDGNPINLVHGLVQETNSFTEVETSVAKNEENGGEMDVSAKLSADLLQMTERDGDSADESSGAISLVGRSSSINHAAENPPPLVSPVDITYERKCATAMPVSVDQDSAEKDPSDVNLNGSEISETSLKKLQGNSLSQDSSRKSKLDIVDEKSSQKLHTGRTISKLSSSVKRGKGGNSSVGSNKCMVMASKAQQFPLKPKRAVEGRFEAVQEKLNELLDADGGISKRKDAPRGYLKLLLLTAASGDNGHGEAIQSNRDLSMILDALLKTRSRVVLTDIINKNGLRMLHNIMKQYRKDFKKIPILRKLLKVLEYLAAREILTVDHINVGPPCPGMESFRESILSLTEHDDKQVHQIARNFRDRWLPRNIRKLGYADRDDGFRGLSHNGPSGSNSSRYDRSVRPTEAIDCVRQSMVATTSSVTNAQDSTVVSTESSSTNGTRIRKRKSRWDQPAEDSVSLQQKEKRASPAQSGGPGSVPVLCSLDNHGERNSIEDIPPGFSPSFETPQVSFNASTAAVDISQENMHVPTDAVSSHPQERFISRMPVSYGVPLSILKQFGTPEADNGDCWAIAPGMPFQPFPPLPSYPRDRKRRLSECTVDSWTSNSLEERQPDKCSTSPKCTDESGPSIMIANQAEIEVPCASNQQMFKRMRGSSQDLGKRFFRQQKWNSTNKFPPWVRNRNCW